METKRTVELYIKDLAFDGKAVGELENGKICFVNGGLPGETIEAVIIKNKRRFANAKLLRVLKKSDKRITPRCGHVDICGGCVWQDLTYEDQLYYKQQQVTACVERIGKISEVLVHPIQPAEPVFHYRNKMEYSFNTDNDSFTLGMHYRGEFSRVFDLNECHIAQPIDTDIVRWFREYVATEQLQVYDVVEHTGYMRFIMVRHGLKTDQLMINIVTNYGELPNASNIIERLLESFPSITTICHNQNGQKSNIAFGEIERILYGPGFIEEKIGDKKFKISANSFFQTNSLQAARLYQIGFEMLQPQPDNRVLDLYCGAGSIGILLADKVHSVIGVEVVADAVKSARENAALNNINNISFYEGMVKDFLRLHPAEVADINTVIVDPPRAGLCPKALRRMLRIQPEKILYISCNPATFARDAAEIVEQGYHLPEVKPVDMFPHTMHIELAAVFIRT